MAQPETYQFIETERVDEPELFSAYKDLTDRHISEVDVQLNSSLRDAYPEMIVTAVPARNLNLLQFAAAGFAKAELDSKSEPVIRWRGYVAPPPKGGNGFLADAEIFAKYHYEWDNEHFLLYNLVTPNGYVQYVLKEPRNDETIQSHSSITDKLLKSVGEWITRKTPGIWVYDNYWTRSHAMWEQVQKASWDDVVLDSKMKKALTEVSEKFFDSKDIYEEYGVPWKRGLIFYGPAGNGKTISIKALMHTLDDRQIPTLYVRSASNTYNISAVFQMARSLSPCLLVWEDIDTIVTAQTRSYFFNEVDGLENNDGILMIASTNHLDRLDPGLSQRPSRFDRKYLFPLPSYDERRLYCDYWREKLKTKSIDFPKKLSLAMADITEDFSFAYLKEAFVSTMLDIARNHTDGIESDSHDELEKYEIWRFFKEQVKLLREDMNSKYKDESTSRDTVQYPSYGGAPPPRMARPGMGQQTIELNSEKKLLPTHWAAPNSHVAMNFAFGDLAFRKNNSKDDILQSQIY